MFSEVDEFSAIVSICQRSKVGKRLPDALYVHCSALSALDPLLQRYENQARQLANLTEAPTLVKLSTEKPSLSYLFYPDFDLDPYPALHTSMEIDLRDLNVHYRDYDSSDSPPLLHQKDSLLTTDYPEVLKVRLSDGKMGTKCSVLSPNK